MPPKQTTGAKRGRSSKAGGATAPKKQRASTSAADLDDPFASSNDETAGRRAAEVIDSDEEPSRGRADAEEEEEEPEKTIPSGLVANLLKEMFAREETRMTEGASLAAARYIDVFVREAIARCVHEREGGFLEVRLFFSWMLGGSSTCLAG